MRRHLVGMVRQQCRPDLPQFSPWPVLMQNQHVRDARPPARAERACRGVGRLLMGELHTVARARGCSRVERTTDAPNTDVQAFYVISTGSIFERT